MAVQSEDWLLVPFERANWPASLDIPLLDQTILTTREEEGASSCYAIDAGIVAVMLEAVRRCFVAALILF